MVLEVISLVVVLGAALVPASVSAGSLYYYLDPNQLQLSTLLPPPPAPMSAQQCADQQEIVAAIAARSPAQFQMAEDDSMRSVFFFATSVGRSFQPEKVPVSVRLFSHVRQMWSDS